MKYCLRPGWVGIWLIPVSTISLLFSNPPPLPKTPSLWNTSLKRSLLNPRPPGWWWSLWRWKPAKLLWPTSPLCLKHPSLHPSTPSFQSSAPSSQSPKAITQPSHPLPSAWPVRLAPKQRSQRSTKTGWCCLRGRKGVSGGRSMGFHPASFMLGQRQCLGSGPSQSWQGVLNWATPPQLLASAALRRVKHAVAQSLGDSWGITLAGGGTWEIERIDTASPLWHTWGGWRQAVRSGGHQAHHPRSRATHQAGQEVACGGCSFILYCKGDSAWSSSQPGYHVHLLSIFLAKLTHWLFSEEFNFASGMHVRLTEDIREGQNIIIAGQNEIIHLLERLVHQNEDWALGLSAKALGKHQAVIESDEDEELDEDGRRKKRRMI